MHSEYWEAIQTVVSDYTDYDMEEVTPDLDLSDELDFVRSDIVKAIEDWTKEEIDDYLIGWTNVREIISIFKYKEELAKQLQKLNITF